MVAEAVEEAVGVGRDAGGGERDQGTEGRRRAFERQLFHLAAVHVGVEGGVGLDQVPARLDGDGLGASGNLEHQFQVDPNCRADLDALAQRAEAVGRDCDPVGVEGNAGE